LRILLLGPLVWSISLSAFSFVSTQDSPKLKDYYQEAYGFSEEELFFKLQRIISSNHHSRGYGALYTALGKAYADNDGVILDYYSTNPNGNSPYEYDSGDKCGNYRGEGYCWNREHLFPQSIFGKRTPMKSDYHHIVPTDGYVNNRRGHLPFGEVTKVEWTSLNGSKRGTCKTCPYKDTTFEPIDEFKGDIARALFYFAVRYQKRYQSWNDVTLDKSTYLFYKPWYIQLLKKWHQQDPPTIAEVERNDAGQRFQKNRNPFIDHPEWVELIW